MFSGAFNRLVVGMSNAELSDESDGSIEHPTVIERKAPPSAVGRFAINPPKQPREAYRVSDSYELIERTGAKVKTLYKKTFC